MVLKIQTFLMLFISFLSFGQKNRTEVLQNYNNVLKEVQSHYKDDPNTYKLKAANFLLTNLYSHKSLISEFSTKEGDPYNFNEFNYDNIDSAENDLKSFIKAGGKHKFISIYDIEKVTSSFIISIVDSSIKAWESSPWKGSYDFNTFCEYILPYRNTFEPVGNNWKQRYYERYHSLINDSEDKEDPIAVCTSLLQEMDYFEFQKKRTLPQPALSIDQMHFRKKGKCEDLASIALLNARAIGLAVTYDFTPHNAASSNSHYWNTIINKNGDHIPFNGSLDLPYNYNANHRRLGKVFRKVFSNPKNNLRKFVKVNQIPEKKLKDPHIIDVTDEYVDTYNIDYKFSNTKDQKVAYITVFNKNKWRAVWWSKISNGITKFTDMGSNIVYLPALTKEMIDNGGKRVSLAYEKYPIWLDKKGNQTVLKPNFKNSFSCSISRDNEEVGPYRDFNTVELIDGQLFNLYYWEGEWKMITKQKVKGTSLSFSGLPKNTLFRLTPENPDRFERIFLIDDTNCKIIWF
ncbi:hypothetical protein Q4Q35_05440 [Flavivirga aquimarina]|uniref:Transglutaminase-like domain-containing protein n=1 Tax=Flavivirga aquimarina TaxID=2027862 RepID=A0ABT8W7Y8_9FLAO|nr:hypothetical protein [Flavivirga aquimarina]MDO5969245.1 hypothetical protein [Flavivirga aquimarina]